MQNLHCAFACANTVICEVLPALGGLHLDLAGESFRFDHGDVLPPEQPGLGLTLTDEIKTRWPVVPGSGEFRVVAKHITGVGVDPATLAEGVTVYDAPWVLELASGQLLHAAYWHDRFGIEHGPGNIQISPSDAHRVWGWMDPQVPAGWHGVRVPESDPTAIVNVRK